MLRYIFDNPSSYTSSRSVVLLATPQEGALIADVAKKFISNPALDDLRDIDKNNGLIERLIVDWTKLVESGEAPRVVCGHETMDTMSMRVVSMASSSRLCSGGAAVPLIGDHSTLVKPNSSNSLAVGTTTLIANSINASVFAPSAQRRLEFPDAKTETGGLTVNLGHEGFALVRVRNPSIASFRYSVTGPLPRGGIGMSPLPENRFIRAGSTDTLELYVTPRAESPVHEFSVVSESLEGPIKVRVLAPTIKEIVERRNRFAQDMQALSSGSAAVHASGANRDFYEAFKAKFSVSSDPLSALKLRVDQEFGGLSEATRWKIVAESIPKNDSRLLQSRAVTKARSLGVTAIDITPLPRAIEDLGAADKKSSTVKPSEGLSLKPSKW